MAEKLEEGEKKEHEVIPKIYLVVMIYPGDELIEQEDVIQLVNQLKEIPAENKDVTIELLLNSSGGNIYAAYKLICLLRSKCSTLRVIVPFYAKSAATLMTLAADEIVMAHQSELGPLDAPMEHPIVEGIRLSALDGVRPLEFLSDFCSYLAIDALGTRIRLDVRLGRKDSVGLALKFAREFVSPIVAKLDPLIINMCYRRLQIAHKYGRELLISHMFKNENNKEELADNTINELVWEYPEHGYAICCSEAKRINLHIKKAESFPDWLKLWELYLEIDRKGEKVIKLIDKDILMKGSNSKDGSAVNNGKS